MAFSEDEGESRSEPLVIARERDTWIAYPYLFEPESGLLWLTTHQGDLQVSAREEKLVGRGKAKSRISFVGTNPACPERSRRVFVRNVE